MNANCESKTVCIIHPNPNANTETFIRAHIERLPARTKVLSGEVFPTYTEENEFLLPPLLARLRRSANVLPHLAQSAIITVGNLALNRFLKKNKVDVILAEFGPTGVGVMDVSVQLDIPLVVHFHGRDAYEKDTLEVFGTAYQKMFSVAQAIIAVSHDMEKQLLNLGVPESKLYYNSYGVDITEFFPRNPATTSPIFLSVGRFVDKKAPHLTLLAFQKVLQACPEARLVMIGNGPLWEACQQLTTALQLSQSVEFLGECSHSEVASRMRSARAFVQHSVKTNSGDSEGTPVSILEAGASGLPIISTHHAGIKDAVIHGETGFLIDEFDFASMAEYMIKLTKNPQLASMLGQAGYKFISNEFSMDKSIKGLWAILNNVIRY